MRIENNNRIISSEYNNNKFRDATNTTSGTTSTSNTVVKTALIHHKLDSNLETNISEKDIFPLICDIP